MRRKFQALRIGIDIHGVIDRHSDALRMLVTRWKSLGHEIHIITGESWKTAEPAVKSFDIPYDHCFSIVDYHIQKGTKMEMRETGWWMDGDEWDRTKGDYCKSHSLDIMFDDTARYARWMPPTTTFVLVGRQFTDVAAVIADLSSVIAGREP